MYLRIAIVICSLCGCANKVYEYTDTGVIYYTDSVIYYVDTATFEYETDTLIYRR